MDFSFFSRIFSKLYTFTRCYFRLRNRFLRKKPLDRGEAINAIIICACIARAKRYMVFSQSNVSLSISNFRDFFFLSFSLPVGMVSGVN